MPEPRATRKPNILFFLPDQHRADWTAMNPALPLRTPTLNRLAGQGTTFSAALCPSPLCAPSRACLAAGRTYDRCRVANNQDDYPLDQLTFYRVLRDHGYHVAGVGKFDLQKGSAQHSLDGKALIDAWGFSDGIDSKGKWDAVTSWDGAPHDAYLAYLDGHGLAQTHIDDMVSRRAGPYTTTHPTPLPEHAYGDNWVAAQGVRMLRDFPDDRPWFLQVNFTGPHDPMDVTQGMWQDWQNVDFPPAHANTQLGVEAHTRIRRNYAAMVENIDRHLSLYLQAIDAREELADTLVVYASDHGEMLGDHDAWGKSTFYQPSVGVPMVIAGPGVARGAVFDGPVSLHDLAATFLEAADVAIPPEMDSRSLWPVLSGASGSHRDTVISGLVTPKRSWHLVYDGRYKLVRIGDAPPLLFDLDGDPWEDVNVAPQRPEVTVRMQAWLDAALEDAREATE
ncbi:MAG: sulfatase-like hydrolase/transferase [Anaerolineae bacterium]|nr:sulfatase-like hydrolase/transferase [Anaerolineae bacterium]